MKLEKLFLFIGFLIDQFVFIWVFFLSAKELASSHYIEGSLLLIAAVIYQRAWKVEMLEYQKEKQLTNKDKE